MRNRNKRFRKTSTDRLVSYALSTLSAASEAELWWERRIRKVFSLCDEMTPDRSHAVLTSLALTIRRQRHTEQWPHPQSTPPFPFKLVRTELYTTYGPSSQTFVSQARCSVIQYDEKITRACKLARLVDCAERNKKLKNKGARKAADDSLRINVQTVHPVIIENSPNAVGSGRKRSARTILFMPGMKN